MAITYTVVCEVYETTPFRSVELADQKLRDLNGPAGLCRKRHHIHSFIDGVQAPCNTCDPVLPNVVKLDGRTVCCDAYTALNMEGTEYCKGCQRAITGRV